LLERSPRRRDGDDDFVALIGPGVRTLGNPALAQAGAQGLLEGLHCRMPGGEARWSISSVQNLPAPDASRRAGEGARRSRCGPSRKVFNGRRHRGSHPNPDGRNHHGIVWVVKVQVQPTGK
jgi:hypothetical protein